MSVAALQLQLLLAEPGDWPQLLGLGREGCYRRTCLFVFLNIYLYICFFPKIFLEAGRGGVSLSPPHLQVLGRWLDLGRAPCPGAGALGAAGGAAVHPPSPAGLCRGSGRSGLRGAEAGGSPSPPCDRPQHPRDARNSDGV